MTRESAIKHKEVIQWWLDNPDEEVLTRNETFGKWYRTSEPEWHVRSLYIQDDEYAIWRIALADGLIVETNAHNPQSGTWYPTDRISTSVPIGNYRTKQNDV